jgi:hypothetical protein
MAQFCLVTGLSPADYRSLTGAEYEAFIKAVEERAGA